MILDKFYDLQRGVTAADGGFSTLLRASWRARAMPVSDVVAGNSKTAWKKAYFPEQGEQGTLVVDGHEIAIFKLSAGLTRDVFGLVQNVKVIVKIEVLALPESMETMQTGQFGGRDDWRTNQHELSYIRRDPAAVFLPSCCGTTFWRWRVLLRQLYQHARTKSSSVLSIHGTLGRMRSSKSHEDCCRRAQHR